MSTLKSLLIDQSWCSNNLVGVFVLGELFKDINKRFVCLFVCYDLRPDMFQSHKLAVVITPPLGVFIQIVCVLALSSLH